VESTATATWGAVVIAGLSMIGTSVGLLIGFLNKRSEQIHKEAEMKYQTEVATHTARMEEKIKYQGERIEELSQQVQACEEDRRDLRERVDQLEESNEKGK
jgi:septal ring factor EnvC (AmiA/AmiB activator)